MYTKVQQCRILMLRSQNLNQLINQYSIGHKNPQQWGLSVVYRFVC